MANNMGIRRMFSLLGMLGLTLLIATVCLGCANTETRNETVETTVRPTEPPEETAAAPEPTPEPTPNPIITSKPTSVPTEVPPPTPTPYDPYTLTDEEAIEMGTYIYDNYIKKYIEIDGSRFHSRAEYYEKEDIINYVCLFNQKYPTVYPDRFSSFKNGNMDHIYNLVGCLHDAEFYTSLDKGENNLFPFYLFLKEGRPERIMLEKIESEFNHIAEDEVSDEEIYEYWGKVFKMAINANEVFKDWHDFDFILFYSMIDSQVSLSVWCPQELFNGVSRYIPAKYILDNNKDTKLDIMDAFYMRNTVNRNKYPGLTNEEFDTYVGCFEEYIDQWAIRNNENNYVKQYLQKHGK